MAGYDTDRRWGYRNDEETDNHNSHARHDGLYHMNGILESNDSTSWATQDDHMSGTTAADPRSAFNSHSTDYMGDTHDGDYTLSHQDSHQSWTNGLADGESATSLHSSRPTALYQTGRGPYDESQDSYQRNHEVQQGLFSTETRSTDPHGSYNYYGAQADSDPVWDYNGEQDGQVEGYEPGNEPDYGALAEAQTRGYYNHSSTDQSGPAYGSGPAYVDTVPQQSYHSARGSRSSRPNRTRNLRVHSSYDFVPGKVLIIDWPEPRGHGIGTTIYSGTGNNVFRKDRRFIVVATHKGHSECISIVTYGGRGCSKPGTHNEDHGIVYSGSKAPDLVAGENTLGFEPVCMIPNNPTEQLHAASRINYSKLHPIEHNYAVEFVGELRGSDMHTVREAVDKCRQEAFAIAMQFQSDVY